MFSEREKVDGDGEVGPQYCIFLRSLLECSCLEMMSGVDLHHNVVRFLWRLVHADGGFGDTSIDFGEVDARSKLTKIAGFFGEAPRRPA
jgi:hypothetical protein